MTDLDNLTTHASKIASLAAAKSMDYFRNLLNIEFKSDESPVTQADKAVETVVRDYLGQHFSDHGILGEEHGSEGTEKTQFWVIDPIDGTRSFLSGHPLFGFLLAHMIDGLPVIGVVGMPALGETYLGVQSKGASLNGAAISVSSKTNAGVDGTPIHGHRTNGCAQQSAYSA